MELLKNTNIDFMKYRKIWIAVSVVLMIVGAIAIVGAFFGFEPLNFGIDFAGGTQLTLRFREAPKVEELRSLLAGAKLGEPVIQSVGEKGSKDVLIKTPAVKGREEGNRDRILAAIDSRYNRDKAGKPDINLIDRDGVTQILLRADPDKVAPQGPDAALAHYQGLAEALLKQRQQEGIFSGWDRVRTSPGLSPAAATTLEQGAFLGDYSVLGVENVGPQIGKELRRQGFLAVAASLLGMLAYIWFRFELRFGIGAVMASLHDVLITFGLFALFKLEFNLTTVAAFLTLIGYSVNDTVVIFDRIREDMRKSRRLPLIEVMNQAINQTLSRTIMTSGLTLLTCVALLIFGGDVLRGFAFVMTVGIIVGTYSSIYIASPFALLWEQLFGSSGKMTKDAPPAGRQSEQPSAAAEPGARPRPRPDRRARARR
jgi:preprotein translocase subunit SecF